MSTARSRRRLPPPSAASTDDTEEDEKELLDPHLYPATSSGGRLVGRGEKQWVMRSHQKRRYHGGDSDSDDDGDGRQGGKEVHLSKRTKSILIVVVLALVIGLGALVYHKGWGKTAYNDVHDFVVFPTVTTPVDLTSAIMSVVGDVTKAVVGAEQTATSAVVGAATTAAAAITQGAAQVTNVAKITGIFGGLR
ncbi:hypothetical protein JCM10213_009190 [Rhodosporidiobolus nylandii]